MEIPSPSSAPRSQSTKHPTPAPWLSTRSPRVAWPSTIPTFFGFRPINSALVLGGVLLGAILLSLVISVLRGPANGSVLWTARNLTLKNDQSLSLSAGPPFTPTSGTSGELSITGGDLHARELADQVGGYGSSNEGSFKGCVAGVQSPNDRSRSMPLDGQLGFAGPDAAYDLCAYGGGSTTALLQVTGVSRTAISFNLTVWQWSTN